MFSRLNRHITLEEYFSRIYLNNYFEGTESLSGPGSHLDQTALIRLKLPELLKDLGVLTFCDLPCGDFNWMRHVELNDVKYLGIDISKEVIGVLQEKYSSDKREFMTLNLVEEVPPKSDLILCRDLLVHLSQRDAMKAILNIRKSGSRYLLTTTFPSRSTNKKINYKSNVTWYPINLQVEPFNFSSPISVLNEGCTEADGAFADKSLALYEIRSV